LHRPKTNRGRCRAQWEGEFLIKRLSVAICRPIQNFLIIKSKRQISEQVSERGRKFRGKKNKRGEGSREREKKLSPDFAFRFKNFGRIRLRWRGKKGRRSKWLKRW
jgi:hypothetical protein